MEFLVSHFSDLEIISLEESQQVAAIKYETEYRELLQIFFTILHLNEKSDRVLELTLKILTINPAHFTVWQYRRECLLALGKDLQEELYFIDEFAGDNPKNYQIWYHRRALVTLIGPSSVEAELAFTENVFHEDAKNYHAWAHRLFLVTAFNKYDDELDLISVLLEADPRNNSAWNHRWLVQFGRFVDKAAVSLERIASEIAFCFSMLLVVKNNESGWNYLTGILRAFPKQSMVSIKARYSQNSHC